MTRAEHQTDGVVPEIKAGGEGEVGDGYPLGAGCNLEHRLCPGRYRPTGAEPDRFSVQFPEQRQFFLGGKRAVHDVGPGAYSALFSPGASAWNDQGNPVALDGGFRIYTSGYRSDAPVPC